MAGGTVKGAIVGCCCGIVIGTDRITGTQSLSFKRILQHLRKAAAYFDEATKRALVPRRGRVDQDANGRNRSTKPLGNVDALANRTGGIAAIDGDLRNQCVRERMGKQVFGAKLVANGAIGNVLSPLAALLEPSVGANAQRCYSLLHLRSLTPALKGVTIKREKETFAELLNCGKPGRISGKRRAPHGKTNILELVGNDRRRLEPRKTVQASHFSQPVDRHQ